LGLLKSSYSLYHLHGDEFAILNLSESADKFIVDMRELNELLSSKPLEINAKSFPIATTTSISLEKPEMLLATVNMSHSFAKKHKERFIVYSSANSLEREYEENIKWAKIIKQAIADDRIIVYFQPIVDTFTKQIAKYEALVRLIDEDGTLVMPIKFLEQAKRSGQYVELSKIVIEKTIAKVIETGLEFSLNLTIEDILNKSLNQFLDEKLKNCTCCKNLTFEIVESEGIENFDEVNQFIKKIRLHGCKLAIDDFGTGYSNFEYLLKLASDYVKIDGSLIRNIDTNQDYYDIVKTIVEFAKIKKLTVIAEFVSNEEIYKKVLELGIPYSQGYYFSPPIHM
jgi:EAL domain-containing protein (putative c-di-GMP-specific phosphodiesterase class I)